MLKEHPKRSQTAIKELQGAHIQANPDYEQMEGVVAGVPSLADYDVIIDAGADGSDPENAVPFDIKTAAGQDLQAAGQLLRADRDVGVRHRAEVPGQGRQGRPRRRRQGHVPRGAARRGLPARRLQRLRQVREGARRVGQEVAADARGRVHGGGRDDADDVASTSTRGRTRASSPAARPRRRASSPPRACSDIRDILGGLVLIYDSIKPARRRRSTSRRPTRPRPSWASCTSSPSACFNEEQGGKKFTAVRRRHARHGRAAPRPRRSPARSRSPPAS